MNVLRQIRRDPALAYYFAQKAVRWPSLRRSCAYVARWGVPAWGADPSDDHVTMAAFETLQRDGLVMLPSLNLDRHALDRIYSTLISKPLRSYYASDQVFSIDAVPAIETKLTHAMTSVLACDDLVRLANHPMVLSLAGRMLGAKPTLAAMLSWWTFGEHHQLGSTHFDDTYHRDVDDFAFVKLFAYLTDVTERNGAHSFVKGSHKSNRLTRRGPISDREVALEFPGCSVTLAGLAGTVFMENTWGIHRPLLATEGRRLIFSAVYTLRSTLPGVEARSDRPLPSGLDPYINRRLFRIE